LEAKEETREPNAKIKQKKKVKIEIERGEHQSRGSTYTGLRKKKKKKRSLSRSTGAKMIYRRWSLLTSTIVIWGGIATAGIAAFYLSGAKVQSTFTSSLSLSL
jgi:hypothetical protein